MQLIFVCYNNVQQCLMIWLQGSFNEHNTAIFLAVGLNALNNMANNENILDKFRDSRRKYLNPHRHTNIHRWNGWVDTRRENILNTRRRCSCATCCTRVIINELSDISSQPPSAPPQSRLLPAAAAAVSHLTDNDVDDSGY